MDVGETVKSSPVKDHTNECITVDFNLYTTISSKADFGSYKNYDKNDGRDLSGNPKPAIGFDVNGDTKCNLRNIEGVIVFNIRGQIDKVLDDNYLDVIRACNSVVVKTPYWNDLMLLYAKGVSEACRYKGVPRNNSYTSKLHIEKVTSWKPLVNNNQKRKAIIMNSGVIVDDTTHRIGCRRTFKQRALIYAIN
ncbi:unnamed protein product [Lepeophtheirus salmonis]|uniref:(salmon louse) hypothetical protein n=1 Tax=Lepeophtheirus salmonis TaxID=72036 RepID=A0A7R8CNL3_LEPSM|nr:unnamed protein product [Lepeophtheirus salmonis]CAF2876346.1 unnamed protein product [Lepeophtheirus salmonis]